MPRVLTAARARVRPEHVAAYLAAAAELAAAARREGRHFWLFRRGPEEFLEFLESHDAAAHPALGGGSVAEQELIARMRSLAVYEADANAVWEEVV